MQERNRVLTQTLVRFKERSQRKYKAESSNMRKCVFDGGEWRRPLLAKGTSMKMMRAWPSMAVVEDCKRWGMTGFRNLILN